MSNQRNVSLEQLVSQKNFVKSHKNCHYFLDTNTSLPKFHVKSEIFLRSTEEQKSQRWFLVKKIDLAENHVKSLHYYIIRFHSFFAKVKFSCVALKSKMHKHNFCQEIHLFLVSWNFRKLKKVKKERMPTAPSVPKRSPIQVLTGLDAA